MYFAIVHLPAKPGQSAIDGVFVASTKRKLHDALKHGECDEFQFPYVAFYDETGMYDSRSPDGELAASVCKTPWDMQFAFTKIVG